MMTAIAVAITAAVCGLIFAAAEWGYRRGFDNGYGLGRRDGFTKGAARTRFFGAIGG